MRPVLCCDEENIMPRQLPRISTCKILLPIDFSSSSYAALETAAEIAGHFKAELYLIHVIPKLPIVTEADFFDETAVLQNARNHAEQQLAKHVASLASKGIGLVPILKSAMMHRKHHEGDRTRARRFGRAFHLR